MKAIETKLDSSFNYLTLDLIIISVNDVITFDVYALIDDEYIVIIEAGALITNTLYIKLQNYENLYISKTDINKQTLSSESLKYYIRYNRDNHEKRLSILYDITSNIFDVFINNSNNKIDTKCVESIIESIIFLIKYDKFFIKNTMPYLRNESFLEYHSLHVALYALTLGYALNYSETQLLNLGIAALLFDVGLKKIDINIIDKEGALSEQEHQIIQKHSRYSVEIIKHNKIFDPYILNAVMHHHERYDGSGYPNRLTKDDISDFASIIAIYDVFDALTSDRPYRKSLSSFEALRLMMKDPKMLKQFNQKYLMISLKILSQGHV